jgi:hypothetical protein
VELDDPLIELRCEWRDARVVRAAGGYDDIVGEEGFGAADHVETIPDLGQSVDFDASSDRKLELAGVGL